MPAVLWYSSWKRRLAACFCRDVFLVGLVVGPYLTWHPLQGSYIHCICILANTVDAASEHGAAWTGSLNRHGSLMEIGVLLESGSQSCVGGDMLAPIAV